MSLSTMLWQTSTDGITWSDMKTPSKFVVNYEDIDDNSYRSVNNGNLIRKRVSRTWVKVEMIYSYLTDDQVDTIARAVNTNDEIYVRMKSPAFGNVQSPATLENNTWIKFEAYVSKYKCECLEGQRGWNMSFNIIQSKKGTHQ